MDSQRKQLLEELKEIEDRLIEIQAQGPSKGQSKEDYLREIKEYQEEIDILQFDLDRLDSV